MKLALILVHNKGDKENAEQISLLKDLLTEVVDGPFINEETGESWTSIHHEINGFPFPHEVIIKQIIPYGVIRPEGWSYINSGGIVEYGKGDEDKVGDHPRFFNWALKRGTDNGADIVVYIEDIKKFDVDDLAVEVNSLIDPEDKHEFVEDPSGKIASLKLLKEVGFLNEGKSKSEALGEFKQKIRSKDLKVSEVKNG